MAVTLGTYSHAHYQSLPSLNTARDMFLQSDGPRLIEALFRDLFVSNGMTDTFGLAMMHRHGDMADGQVMVTYNNTSTPWNATPGCQGMDTPQPMILGFSPKGELVPTEFRYSKGHKLEIGEKELAFASKVMVELDKVGLRHLFGLREYPGDDFQGTCEITEGAANINLQPKDYPDGLVQTDTAWYFSDCKNRPLPWRQRAPYSVGEDSDRKDYMGHQRGFADVAISELVKHRALFREGPLYRLRWPTAVCKESNACAGCFSCSCCQAYDADAIQIQAINLICYVFPSSLQLDPVRLPKMGPEYLPLMTKVRLWSQSQRLPEKTLRRLVETLWSASQVGPAEWKNQAIVAATDIAQRVKLASLWHYRLLIRIRVLARLHPELKWPPIGQDSLEHVRQMFAAPETPEDRALLGEVGLCIAQSMVDCNELERASEVLQSCSPKQHINELSKRDQGVQNCIDLTQANICRFAGDFSTALSILNTLYAREHGVFMHPRIVPRLAAVLTEMGNFDHARHLTEAHLASLTELGRADHGTSRQCRLAMAEAWLGDALSSFINNLKAESGIEMKLRSCQQILLGVKEHLDATQTRGMMALKARLSIGLGLAMVSHLLDDPKAGIKAWDSAEVAASNLATASRWKLSFVSTVICLSRAELYFRLNDPEQATRYARICQLHFAMTGSQRFFTCLGTYWPRVIQKLNADLTLE